MDNPIDAFINAIVDGLKKHEGFKEFVKEQSKDNGIDYTELNERFCELLRDNSYEVNEVALEDFDIDNYSDSITSIIDSHIDDEFMSNRIKGLEWEIQVK
tara:strand:+ start:707 stop:1006 length:300 start_codon:yes stop_codon:yes gene_type:complete